MNVIGKTVNHKTFGLGTVTELTDTTITISFRGAEKDLYKLQRGEMIVNLDYF